MRNFRWSGGVILGVVAFVVVAWWVAATGAADRLRVVATIADLKALTEEVGGNLVEVESLARGNQNPHDLEVRPSLMVKVRRADALVVNGLELDGWAERVVLGANNPRVIPGAAGRIDASRGVPVLEVPSGRVDRSMGDVHPLGNPHYTLDPGVAPIVTSNIVEGLARLAPEHRASFEGNQRQFLARLDEAMMRWTASLAPYRNAKVVSYHADFVYFLSRFGLSPAGSIEDRPGIPPTPGHLTRLIRTMKDERVAVVLVEPWNDRKLAARVAEEAGAQLVVGAASVGALPGTETYLQAVEYNVKALADALGR
jgi:zinc/manganese transport system substrate-binding protein